MFLVYGLTFSKIIFESSKISLFSIPNSLAIMFLILEIISALTSSLVTTFCSINEGVNV